MLLNRFETFLMNNPVRAAIQRFFELPRLIKMGGTMPEGMVLEIGCGRGVGTALLLNQLKFERVDAFDLDPRMVELAQKRLHRYGERTRIWVGNVTDINAKDGAYDHVFDFGIIHHVPDWPKALREVYRVLKPGGRFYAEEVLRKFILSPVWRHLLKHPLENRFDHSEFKKTLSQTEFKILADKEFMERLSWTVCEK